MIKINDVSELFNLEPMKYWAMGSTTTPAQQQQKLEAIIASGEYIFSEKTDGNLIRMIATPERFALQTRGISKKTGEYGEIQGKVFFADAMMNAFEDTTMLVGEAYIEGGTDKTVGSVLRSLDARAKKVQVGDNIVKFRIFDCFYYEGESLLDKPITERIKYLSAAASKINSPLVSYVKYYNADDKTFTRLENIFTNGGEGIVMYKKTMTPVEGRTPAWQTVKVKQTLGQDADCFIYETRPPKREYEGKEIQNWPYWVNSKTDEKLEGNHYIEYVKGGTVAPVTKPYYNEWPGSIACAVMDNGEPRVLCYCSNLTDEFCCELRDNWEEYYMRPIRVQGMLVSEDRFGNVSIRHPKFMGLRDDIAIEDCTFEKIMGEK